MSKLLGIHDTGLCFNDVEEAKTLHPSLKAWRACFPPTSYIDPSLVSSEIQNDKHTEMAHFRTDFALLFLTMMVNSQQNGYIKDMVLKCLKIDTRPWDPKCCWAGPLTILTVNSTRQPACNTGDGVRAIHYWTKELLMRRQDYEISNRGFGHGQVKPLSDGTAEKAVGVHRVSLCAVEKNDESTSGATSYVDKWVDELAVLRSRIEKALGDRLTKEPNNEVHQKKLKRKYIKVLDVLPCFPAEGLKTFEEGEILKRTTGILLAFRPPCQVFV
ncbi:hypothetical protein Hanom_Chr07g00647221 [Helianthus anomalus]